MKRDGKIVSNKEEVILILVLNIFHSILTGYFQNFILLYFCFGILSNQIFYFNLL